MAHWNLGTRLTVSFLSLSFSPHFELQTGNRNLKIYINASRLVLVSNPQLVGYLRKWFMDEGMDVWMEALMDRWIETYNIDCFNQLSSVSHCTALQLQHITSQMEKQHVDYNFQQWQMFCYSPKTYSRDEGTVMETKSFTLSPTSPQRRVFISSKVYQLQSNNLLLPPAAHKPHQTIIMRGIVD